MVAVTPVNHLDNAVISACGLFTEDSCCKCVLGELALVTGLAYPTDGA